MADALAALGAPDDVLDAVRARPTGEDFFYYADNEESLFLFFDVATQWNYVGTMAGVVRTGLNYPGVDSVMSKKRYRRKRLAALFADLQMMEKAALQVFLDEAESRRQ
ncbi:DUF1799 domain-containing protein [Cupriavidus sp.]|uniref:DUF1799 domain-containing protein n=1 Tax=Cupriavidus sp. TaxID=1873897 RepID=UPI003D0C79CF